MSEPPVKKQKIQNKKRFFRPNRKLFLEIGHRGFIGTCSYNERDCVRECYNLLNQYADDLYGPEDQDSTLNAAENEAGTAVDEESGDDVTDDLKKQIEAAQQMLKAFSKKRFQVVDTGATNFVFVKTTISDPTSMAEHIVRDINKTKEKKTRYLLRLLPVEIVCKAIERDIIVNAGQLCNKYFDKEATTFSVVFNKRYNNDVDKDTVIRKIANLIQAKNVKHKVDLRHAKKSLIVEVIKGLCCLSVVNDYMGMKKYNLAELAKIKKDGDKDESEEKKCPASPKQCEKRDIDNVEEEKSAGNVSPSEAKSENDDNKN